MTEQPPEGLLDEQAEPSTHPLPASGHRGLRIHVRIDGHPILDTDSDQLYAMATQQGGRCEVLEVFAGQAVVSMVVQAAWLPDADTAAVTELSVGDR